MADKPSASDYVYDSSQSADDPMEGRIAVLIYGETGTGKTFCFRTLPESMLPALYFDIDGNSRSLKGQFEPGQFFIAQLPKTDPGKTRPTAVSFTWMKEIINAAHKGEFPGGDVRIKTIIIDSLTTWYRDVAAAVLQTSNKDLGDNLTLPERGTVQRGIENTLDLLRFDTSFNVVMTAHEMLQEDSSGGMIKGVPAVTGRQLPVQIPRYFQEVWRSEEIGKKDEQRYIWNTRNKGKFVGRTQIEKASAQIPQDFGVFK